VDVTLAVEGADLAATLTMPPGGCRAGVVLLHGSAAGHRSYFLYQHVSDVLGRRDVAVLRYDRRQSEDGHDVPLDIQAADALTALRRLRDIVDGPVGLWGYSQGAWAATRAAVTEPNLVAFLICVSLCGVSPAVQMRIASAQQLRQRGFSDRAVDDLVEARLAYEGFLRTGHDRQSAQSLLDDAARRTWFADAHLPAVLPDAGAWRDMDYDPQPILNRLSCPVLAFYGETDQWIPIDESLLAWEKAQLHGTLRDLTVVRLLGADHLPTVDGKADPEAIVTEYTQTLARWLTSVTACRPQ
jgi:pimeloyl-ACP methyl ester carboxylesterase